MGSRAAIFQAACIHQYTEIPENNAHQHTTRTYLQRNQNVHLSPFTYSLGAGPLWSMCPARTSGLQAAFLFLQLILKSSRKEKAKQAETNSRLHATSQVGNTSTAHCSVLLHQKHALYSSFSLHSSPDRASFRPAQPCLKQRVPVQRVNRSWNKGERTQPSTLSASLLCKCFNSSKGFI